MKKIILITLVLTMFLFSGCSNPKDPDWEAAGCGGGLTVGGCMGGSIIKDMKVEPAAECLKLYTETCNGAILIIDNSCGEDLKIGDKTIYAGSSKTVEFARNKEGNIFVVEIGGNFEQYNPEDEDLLSVKGKLGEKDVAISYLKRNVCGQEKIPELTKAEQDDSTQSDSENLVPDKKENEDLLSNNEGCYTKSYVVGERISVVDAGNNKFFIEIGTYTSSSGTMDYEIALSLYDLEGNIIDSNSFTQGEKVVFYNSAGEEILKDKITVNEVKVFQTGAEPVKVTVEVCDIV